MRPQATWIRGIASRLSSRTTMERLIEPVLTDVELEHREAARSGRLWLARWIRVSGYVGLCKALALHGVHVCGRALRPDEAATRTMAFSVAAFLVLTLALVLPPLLSTRHHVPVSNLGMLAVYLIPQALPLSIPVALSFGIACGWPRDTTARTMLRQVIVPGIAASVVVVAAMEWLVPAANQAFRAAAIRQIGADRVHISRGINERSLSELASLIRQTSPDRWPNEAVSATIRELSAGNSAFSRETLQQHFHLKVALCLATAALGFLAVAIASVIHRRNLARTVFFSIFLAYIAAYFGAPATAHVLPAAAVAWLPNAGLAAVSVLFLGVSSGRRTSDPRY
ncbi:MAG: LptF/LptG family permease [Vicinamibacterales bacterium]